MNEKEKKLQGLLLDSLNMLRYATERMEDKCALAYLKVKLEKLLQEYLLLQ